MKWPFWPSSMLHKGNKSSLKHIPKASKHLNFELSFQAQLSSKSARCITRPAKQLGHVAVVFWHRMRQVEFESPIVRFAPVSSDSPKASNKCDRVIPRYSWGRLRSDWQTNHPAFSKSFYCHSSFNCQREEKWWQKQKQRTTNHQNSREPMKSIYRQLCVFAETLLVFDAPRINQKIAIAVSVVLLLLTPMAGSQKGAWGPGGQGAATSSKPILWEFFKYIHQYIWNYLGLWKTQTLFSVTMVSLHSEIS